MSERQGQRETIDRMTRDAYRRGGAESARYVQKKAREAAVRHDQKRSGER